MTNKKGDSFFKRRSVEWITVGLIMLLGLWLRWHDYGAFPVAGETKDEFAWTWLGQSLLAGQLPTSWSWFPAYENATLVQLAGQEYRIVAPVFDNPPLFSLIPGLMVQLKGISGIQIPPITLIRLPMLFLGMVSVGLTYGVGKLWFNRETGTMAALFMATIPSFVLASRLVLAENLLLIWMLLAFIALARFQSSGKRKWLVAMGLIAGLSILTKVTGVFVSLTLGLYLLHLKQIRHLAFFSLVTLLTASLWLAYAGVYGFGQFFTIQLSQASLPIGFGTLSNLFIRQNIADKPFLDGWFVAGVVSLFWLFLKVDVKEKWNGVLLLALASFSWLVVLIASVGEQTWHGWYRFPLFPLMSMGMAFLLYQGKSIFTYGPLLFLAVLPTFRLSLLFGNLHQTSLLIRMMVISLILLVALALLRKPAGLAKKILPLILLIMVVLNSLVVLRVTDTKTAQDDLYFFPIRTGI